MHIGQGTRPTTCCRYRPQASSATQARLISASTRRGVRSIQFHTIMLVLEVAWPAAVCRRGRVVSIPESSVHFVGAACRAAVLSALCLRVHERLGNAMTAEGQGNSGTV